jgi:very-short-patch-repair endonuclease
VRVDPVSVPAAHLTYLYDVPVTTISRTAIDLTAGTPDMELQAIFDSALRLGVGKDELRSLVKQLGIRRNGVLDLIDHADARSESALESISRWLYRARGLPTPELQVPMSDEFGSFARVDFFWRKELVIGEADGKLKYDDQGEAKRAEEERQERLEALGLTVIRWRWEDVMIHQRDLVARVRAVLEG